MSELLNVMTEKKQQTNDFEMNSQSVSFSPLKNGTLSGLMTERSINTHFEAMSM